MRYIKRILGGLIALLSASCVMLGCAESTTISNTLNIEGVITDSSCVNPVLLAISSEDISELHLPDPKKKISRIGKSASLVRGLFVSPDTHEITTVYNPSEYCIDKSIIQLYQFDHWSPKPRPLNPEAISLYLKIIDLKMLNPDEDGLHCTRDRIHNNNISEESGFKYRICRYTFEKIEVGTLDISTYLDCKFQRDPLWDDARGCYEKMLPERQRVVDLGELGLITDLSKAELQSMIDKLDISEKTIGNYHVDRKNQIYASKRDCSKARDQYEIQECRLGYVRRRNEAKSTAEEEIIKLLLVSLKASLALNEVATQNKR